jgi:hypothetical protein
MFLSLGDERAMTTSRGRIMSTCAGVSVRNTGPSITRPPSRRMPHSRAIAVAVTLLSPVTMRTVTPACTIWWGWCGKGGTG